MDKATVSIVDTSDPIQRILRLLAEGHGYALGSVTDATIIVAGDPAEVRVSRADGSLAERLQKPIDVDEFLTALAKMEAGQ